MIKNVVRKTRFLNLHCQSLLLIFVMMDSWRQNTEMRQVTKI